MAAISARMALHYFPSASSARHFHFSEIASFSCLASQQMDVLGKLQIIMPVQGEKESEGEIVEQHNISISQVLNMWNHCFFLLSLLCVCVNALLCVHYASLLQSFGRKSYYWYIQTSLCNARKFNVAWMLCWIVWEIQLREASCDQRWTVLFIYMVM